MDANAIHLELLINRRSRDLASATRNEILLSVGAAVLFLLVMSWRLPLSPFGIAGVAVWAGFVVYRFRSILWPAEESTGLAATGLAYYRSVLEHRRGHLKNAWLWHGPLMLAVLTFVAAVMPLAFPDFKKLRNMAPFFALLIVWIIVGTRLRHSQAAALRQELEELERG